MSEVIRWCVRNSMRIGTRLGQPSPSYSERLWPAVGCIKAGIMMMTMMDVRNAYNKINYHIIEKDIWE